MPPSDETLRIAILRAHAARLWRRVDWPWLLPALAGLAWYEGFASTAIALAFAFPMLMAIRPFRLADARAPAIPLPAPGAHPVARGTAHRVIDDTLRDCSARGRTTAVLCLRIAGIEMPGDGWSGEDTQDAMDRLVHRIVAALRGQDVVLRTGEATLCVILAPTRRADLDATMSIVDRLQASVGEPLSMDGRAIRARCAIGLCTEAMAPERRGSAMLTAAECALADARHHGGNAVRAFTPDMRRRVETGRQLTRQVEMALDKGQIRPWFQPQVEARTGRLVGFEALARWDHPELGVLGPGHFLQAISSAGRAAELGEQILRAGLEALRDWDAAGIDVPSVGINVALEELSDPRFAERVIWQVDRFEHDPRRIAFEILETVTLRDGDQTVMRNVQALRDAGFRLDLDDFGTAAASIAHISRFGVHRIKIDRSFISGIDADPARQRVVTAILGLAAQLDIETLAEGVETPEEETALARMGCAQIQGHAIACPMPWADTVPWALARGRDGRAGLHAMSPRGTA